MNVKHDFPTLKNFIGGFYHQNWIDVVAALGLPVTTDSPITQMLQIADRGYVSYLRDELEQLRALNLDEDELKELLRTRYTCGDDPYVDGSTWQYWIEHLRDRLNEHLKFSL